MDIKLEKNTERSVGTGSYVFSLEFSPDSFKFVIHSFKFVTHKETVFKFMTHKRQIKGLTNGQFQI